MIEPSRAERDPHLDLSSDWLFATVYDELRGVARMHMGGERDDHTLQTTALVHEAFLRLVGSQQKWESRRQFLFAAAREMRRILIEHARKYKREKHGGKHKRVPLKDEDLAVEERLDELLALDVAIEKLARLDEAHADIVKLRYFAGLTIEQTAQALDCSISTVKAKWQIARAWLHDEVKRNMEEQ
jgi:RNA polymerase sigma factor (TIGR02999 family)